MVNHESYAVMYFAMKTNHSLNQATIMMEFSANIPLSSTKRPQAQALCKNSKMNTT